MCDLPKGLEPLDYFVGGGDFRHGVFFAEVAVLKVPGCGALVFVLVGFFDESVFVGGGLTGKRERRHDLND